MEAEQGAAAKGSEAHPNKELFQPPVKACGIEQLDPPIHAFHK